LRVEREHLVRCRDRSCLFRLDDPGHNAQGSNGGDYGKGATFGGSGHAPNVLVRAIRCVTVLTRVEL